MTDTRQDAASHDGLGRTPSTSTPRVEVTDHRATQDAPISALAHGLWSCSFAECSVQMRWAAIYAVIKYIHRTSLVHEGIVLFRSSCRQNLAVLDHDQVCLPAATTPHVLCECTMLSHYVVLCMELRIGCAPSTRCITLTLPHQKYERDARF